MRQATTTAALIGLLCGNCAGADEVLSCTDNQIEQIIVRNIYELPKQNYFKRQAQGYEEDVAKDDSQWPTKQQYLQRRRQTIKEETTRLNAIKVRIDNVRQSRLDRENNIRYCVGTVAGVEEKDIPLIFSIGSPLTSFGGGACNGSIFYKIEQLAEKKAPYVSWKCTPFTRSE